MATKAWIAANKDRLRKYRRDWYARNCERAKAAVVARKKKIRAWLRAEKDKLSCKCGETFWACLDFHHLKPEAKVTNIAAAVAAGWSIKRLRAEIKKCGVLCANCHRKETFKGR